MIYKPKTINYDDVESFIKSLSKDNVTIEDFDEEKVLKSLKVKPEDYLFEKAMMGEKV